LNSAAHAHTPRRSRSWLPALVIFLIPSVLLVTFLSLRIPHPASPALRGPYYSLATNWQASLESGPALTDSHRTVFPYSVIPGGVRDAHELNAAVAKDPVVAEHYSNFNVARAHTIRLDRPTPMYVSYRLNDHVYWTRNRMLIPAGETLITDGENLARVRCGNRLSALAIKPVSLGEPPVENLENPAYIPPLLADLMPGESIGTFAPDLMFPPTPILPDGGPAPMASNFLPILGAGVPFPGSNTSTTPPGGPTGPGIPPVATPEPAAVILLAGGVLLSVALCALLRK
jgi:hypothetical protein